MDSFAQGISATPMPAVQRPSGWLHDGIPDVTDIQDIDQLIPVFNPETAPIRGMRSAVTASAIQPGEWSLIENFRLDDLTCRVREGSAKMLDGVSSGGLSLTATIAAIGGSCAFRGGCFHVKTGICYIALSDGSAVRVYYYSPSGNTWYEITADGSGATYYGNTRFPGTTNWVQFAIVREPVSDATIAYASADTDFLIMQTGASGQYPLVCVVYDVGSIYPGLVAPHKPISQPKNDRSYFEAVPWKVWDVSTISGKTAKNTGAGGTHFDPVVAGSGATSQLNLTAYSATIATNDWAGFQGHGTTFDVKTANQLHLVYSCTDPQIWSRLKIQIRSTTGPTWRTIYDPSVIPVANPSTLVTIDATYSMFACSVDNSTLVTGEVYDGIRFVWIDAAPATNTTISFYLFAFSKGRLGGASFGISFFSTYSRAESPGLVCRDNGGALLGQIGGTDLKTIKYPVTTTCYYRYQIYTAQPDLSDVPLGTDLILTYCKEYGASKYSLVNDPYADNWFLFQQGAGSWGYVNGLVSPPEQVSGGSYATTSMYRSRYVENQALLNRDMPDGQNIPIPIGSCMAVSNSRLFVGGIRNTASVDKSGVVAVSDKNNPFRFRYLERYIGTDGLNMDTTSPCWIQFAGEIAQAFAVLNGQFIGGDSLICLTDKSAWQMQGVDANQITQPSKVGPIGTLSPRSIAIYYSTVMWLDTNRQVRMYPDQATPSWYTIEDVLKAIPGAQIGNATACVAKDRYYLAVAESGASSNAICLIFDFRTRTWIKDRLSSKKYAGFMDFSISGSQRFAFIHSTGQVYEYELAGATTDAGDNINVDLISREYHTQFWDQFDIGRIGIVAEKSAGVSLTTKRLTRSNTTAPTNGTIDLTGIAGQNHAILWDKNAALTIPGPIRSSDVGQRIELTGTLPGGLRIYCIVMEGSRTIGGAQVA